MKKIAKVFFGVVCSLLIMTSVCACGKNGNRECKTAEEVKLETVVLNEVEFNNGETVSLKQSCGDVEITGTIDAMTDAQKSVFGNADTTHVVSLKITFDKERTLDYFEIKGNVTKVYSTNSNDANYVGAITDLLDNESGEDAYSNLILSANTKNYVLTAKYSDGHESEIKIKVSATLATAESE